MTIERTAINVESQATLHPSGMYFVPLTGRPFDVTDETLAVWATEDLRAEVAARRVSGGRGIRSKAMRLALWGGLE